MNILNISNVNYEDAIKRTIKDVLENYKDLTREQTCFIFSSLIYEKLRNYHILSRIISTKDFGLSYEHRFVLVKDNEWYYLVDLTFAQFRIDNLNEFKELLENGYQKISKDELKKYLLIICKEHININLNTYIF